MSKIVKYLHNGIEVNVQEHLKGEHKKYCLCWLGCRFFKPGGEKIKNCHIANALFQMCVNYDLEIPVFECSKYEKEK